MVSDISDDPASTGPSGVVRERGRDLWFIGRAVDGNKGVVALTGEDMDDVVELVGDAVSMVWYVRTGRRSTTDFGARHLLRRIRERRSSSA